MSASTSLQDQIAAALRKPGVQLPVFTPVALELQQLMRQDDVASERIEALIQRDPALSIQVLRMANSSVYSGLMKITTLRQAVARVGTRQILRIAFAAAQQGLYRSTNPKTRRDMDFIWQAALGAAHGAAWIAERSGHADLSEQAFLAGLLHDIGKLVILRAFDELAAEAAPGRSLPDTLVHETMDALHCGYGEDLLRRWNLPEEYCVVARDHHLAHLDAGNVLLVCVRLADLVCRRSGIGMEVDSEIVPAASEEASALCLGEVQLADLEVNLEDALGLAPA
jgi:HD-like signal output (HDOD) protein